RELSLARQCYRDSQGHVLWAGGRPVQFGGGGRDLSRERAAGSAGAADPGEFDRASSGAIAGDAGKFPAAGEIVLAGGADAGGECSAQDSAKGDGRDGTSGVALAAQRSGARSDRRV